MQQKLKKSFSQPEVPAQKIIWIQKCIYGPTSHSQSLDQEFPTWGTWGVCWGGDASISSFSIHVNSHYVSQLVVILYGGLDVHILILGGGEGGTKLT